MSVTHVYKEWLIFQSLTYLAKYDPLFQVSLTSKCDNFDECYACL